MPGTIVLSPHPDDETLGAGGTLLRRRQEGDRLFWLNVTDMAAEFGHPPERIRERSAEIDAVARAYAFDDVFNLRLEPLALDTVPMRELVERIAAVFARVQPRVVLLPHPGDAHTDHAVVFRAGLACTKAFRQPSVKTVLTMEIPSESHFGPDGGFCPSYFVDVTDHLDEKIEIMRIYAGEMGEAPFPRSEESIRALGTLRGTQAGCRCAEGFGVVRLCR